MNNKSSHHVFGCKRIVVFKATISDSWSIYDCINHFQDVKPGNLLVSSSNAIVLTVLDSSRRCNDDGYYYPEKSCISTL